MACVSGELMKEKEVMKIVLAGDVSPTEMTDPLFEAGETKRLFQDVRQVFSGADLRIVNLECALTKSTEPIAKIGPALKASPNTAAVLKELGVDICGLSNNHIFDYGKKGAADTRRYLEEAGICSTGYGKDYADARKNLIWEAGGEKIGLIAVCEHEYSYALEDREGARPFDPYDTMEDIRKAAAECSRVIVLYHGGKEHCAYPSPRLKAVCRAMAKCGASVVLCQHSHCIGCYEEYEGCHILYGQGNFHFRWKVEEPIQKSWDEALIVSYDTLSHEISFLPQTVSGEGIALAKGEQAKEILDSFNGRSRKLKTGEWKAEWRKFCESADWYRKAAVNGAKDPEMFAHYLDCEAHLDVWKELYQTRNHSNEK